MLLDMRESTLATEMSHTTHHSSEDQNPNHYYFLNKCCSARPSCFMGWFEVSC